MMLRVVTNQTMMIWTVTVKTKNKFQVCCNKKLIISHLDKMSLSKINEHPRDKNITFVEETHEYFINGSKDGYISTTTLIHNLFPKFDADDVIKKMRASKKWNSHNKYFKMTDAEIKKSWDDNCNYACKEGTAMHLNIENYYNGEDHETESKEFKLFQKYLDETDYKIYRTEMLLYDEEAKISGSADSIYRDPVDGKYIIGDWKRSKEIKMENRWQRGTHEITRDLDDCNFNHYSLQLGIYKYMMEKNYGMIVKDCFLVILHPSQESYIKIQTRNMDEYVRKIFQMRINPGISELKDAINKKSSVKSSFNIGKLKF